MRANLRLVSDDVPLMQLERKRVFARLEAEARSEEEHSIEMLAYLMTFGVTVTACLLIWWYA